MTGCASSSELEQLLAERLPAGAAARLTAHVDGCPHCQDVMERLAARTAVAPRARPNDTDAQPRGEFLERLKKQRPSGLARAHLRASDSGTDVISGSRAPGRGDDPVAGDEEPDQFPQIGPHAVLKVLGEGGMGVVYKARHVGLDRLVAIKMLRGGAFAGKEDLERFRREAQAVGRLQHPNIVQVFEVGDHDGRPYFSMGLVEGDNLAGSRGTSRVFTDSISPPTASG